MKYIKRFCESVRLTDSDLEKIDDMFVTVADSWELSPVPTEGYESKSHFHGDYSMTVDGDKEDYINLEIDTPLPVTEEMKSTLNTFLKRLGAYGWSYVTYSEERPSNRIMNTPDLDYDSIPVKTWNFVIWKESVNESIFESYNPDPIFRQIDLFLNSSIRNKWIDDDPENPIMSLYIRKSKRFVDGRCIDFFDLASITIEESHRGQKIFQNFLKRLISDYPFNIYVESIQNPAVDHVCQKFGFIKDMQGDPIISNRYLIRKTINESVSGKREYKEIPMSDWSKLVDNPDEKYTNREIQMIEKISAEKGMELKFFNRDIFQEKDMDIFDLFVTDIDSGDYKASIIKKEDMYYLVLVRIRTETSINDRFYGFICDQERGLREFIEDFRDIVMDKIKKTTV